MGYWAKVACGDLSPSGIARMIKTGIAEVSVDHISLGSDFDGSVETAFDTSELLILTHALLEVGLSQEDIRKLMGENLIRFLRARLKQSLRHLRIDLLLLVDHGLQMAAKPQLPAINRQIDMG